MPYHPEPEPEPEPHLQLEEDVAIGLTSGPDDAGARSRAGRLQKLGGKDKDRWQAVDVKADASGLCWTSGNALRDAASGSQRRLRVQELVSAEYWSDIGIEFGFEVVTTAKQGKVYKFSASAAAERDSWVSIIKQLIAGSSGSGGSARLAPLLSADSLVGGETRLRVVKTATLRSGFEPDSPVVGSLQRGEVIAVLEARELILDEAAGVRTVRVRLDRGWTSTVSRAGNRMLAQEADIILDRSSRGSAAVQPPTAEGFTTLGNPLSVSEATAAPAPRDHVQVQVRAGAGCGRWFLLWIVLMVGMWWNMHRRSTSADHDPLG